jgi:adenylate cyclase
MPTEEKTTRKLRAILSADVKGYSLLMADDEAHTVKKLKEYRDSISNLIRSHSGRVVDAVGDNLLAEFSSAVAAVQCSVEIQKDLKEKNEDLQEDRRLEFRIGINIGDVIQDGDRIYGTGVNVAARIEGLAEPGGICISRNAYDHIKEKLSFGYEYLGEHEVKNIKEPVRVYKVLMAPEDVGKLIGEKPKAAVAKWIWPTVVAAVIVLTLISYQLYQAQVTPEYEIASIDKMAFPLPEEPSIAVLPFTNMTGDPEQDYLSDGFTEHIITSLSKVPYIFVIARNSTFSYKGKSVKIQQIAEELSVQYVLKGSLQRSNDRVRITVQLIDATTGHHLWAENYDRSLIDIFALQDEIAMQIMAGLQLELTVEELGNLSTTKTKNIRAYEKFLMGSEHIMRRTVGDSQQAKKLAQEAISLDPEYSVAYLLLARAYLDDVWYYKTESVAKTLDTVEHLIKKSIDLSGQDATSHHLLGTVYYLRKQYDKAVTECRKAVDLSPNSADANYWYGHALRYAGRFEEAIIFFKKAIRLNPITPMNYINNLAWAYAYSEQYEKAIPIWNKAIERNPDYFFAYLGLTMVYQLSGNELKAREAAAEVMRLKPKLTVSMIAKGPATKNFDRERGLEALRKAGIPE